MRTAAFGVLLLLACSGALPVPDVAPTAAPTPAPTPAPAPPVTGPPPAPIVVQTSRVSSDTPQLVARGPKGLALHIPLSADGPPPDDGPEDCGYSGLPDGAEGLLMAVVDLESRASSSFVLAKVPSQRDPTCTAPGDRESAEREGAAAVAKLGLQASESGPWSAFAKGADGTWTAAPQGGAPVSVQVEHTSDAGYHRYAARLVDMGWDEPVFTHEPNPAGGGSGELVPVGLLAAPEGRVLLLRATHGPGGLWSNWVVVGPL